MANVTVTVDDELLARVEAERADKSLSRYLADLIAAENARLRAESAAMFKKTYSPQPWTFDRDEIYDRPYPGGRS